MEGPTQKDILNYLKKRGIYHWRNNTGAVKRFGVWIRYGKEGSPDILGSRGVMFGIEVKDAGKKPSSEQLEEHEKIRRSGGHVLVAWSLDDVLNDPFFK